MRMVKKVIKKAIDLKTIDFIEYCTMRGRLLVRQIRFRWKGVQFGPGLVVQGGIEISSPRNVHLGRDVTIGKNVGLGAWPKGELIVGDNTYIGRRTIILAYQSVVIGNDCLISPGCYITDLNHGIAPGELIRKQPYVFRPIHIGNDIWIGTGAVILPGVTIGNGAVIGARAVVTHDVPENAIVVGIPARLLRYRTDPPVKSRC